MSIKTGNKNMRNVQFGQVTKFEQDGNPEPPMTPQKKVKDQKHLMQEYEELDDVMENSIEESFRHVQKENTMGLTTNFLE